MSASRAFAPARRIRLLVLLLGVAGLAGCDKCGNRVNLNAPSLQHSCGDATGPAR